MRVCATVVGVTSGAGPPRTLGQQCDDILVVIQVLVHQLGIILLILVRHDWRDRRELKKSRPVEVVLVESKKEGKERKARERKTYMRNICNERMQET